jgi:cytochrome c oxidase subunit IV
MDDFSKVLKIEWERQD